MPQRLSIKRRAHLSCPVRSDYGMRVVTGRSGTDNRGNAGFVAAVVARQSERVIGISCRRKYDVRLESSVIDIMVLGTTSRAAFSGSAREAGRRW